MISGSPSHRGSALASTCSWSLIATCFALVVWNAWVCDDAFITLRTVDNLVHNRGLTWNPGERVQAYTHPLWMFLVSAPYFLTREPYYTTLGVSLVATLAFLVLTRRLHSSSERSAALVLLALIASKPFVEFSTSGLENPLTHLLVCLVWWSCWKAGDDERGLRLTCFLSALTVLNRLDLALVVAPAVLSHAWRAGTALGWKVALRAIAVGSLPFLLWEAFSLFYYGRLLPNTAYAKLNTGIPWSSSAAQGLRYLWSNAIADPVGSTLICVAIAWPCVKRDRRLLPASLGILAWLLYQLRIGGDFMVGRYVTPALALACLVVVRLEWRALPWSVAIGLVALLSVAWPASPIRRVVLGAEDEPLEYSTGVGDEWSKAREASALFRGSRPGPENHTRARRARARADAVARGDEENRPVVEIAIGFYGFYAGPDTVVIDALALADPLLSALPMVPRESWRPGHYLRAIPAGYVETRFSGDNRLEDAGLAAYWDEVALVASGNLWSGARLAAIWRLNVGALDPLLDTFVAGIAERGPLVLEDAESPHRLTIEWAIAKHETAQGLIGQARATTGAERSRLLLKAVSECLLAMSAFDHEELTRERAMTRNTQSMAALALAEHSDGTERSLMLSEVVSSCHFVLELLAGEDYPREWMATQDNLATAFEAQARSSDGENRIRLLREAVAAKKRALEVAVEESTPADVEARRRRIETAEAECDALARALDNPD